MKSKLHIPLEIHTGNLKNGKLYRFNHWTGFTDVYEH